MSKCPYCEEENVEAVAIVTVEIFIPVTACVYAGKLDYDTEAGNDDLADSVNEQVATEVDEGNVQWHCSECEHKLTRDEVMAMLTEAGGAETTGTQKKT